MPHAIVKLWPGKSEEQKTRLTEEITRDVMEIQNYPEESISVALQKIEPQDWPDIVAQPGNLHKKPGYTM
jgi:4-oxalocrotonate tautomerase